MTADGVITGPQLTLDSIFLYGTGDATVYLDTVAHNPNGSLLAPAIPGDANGDGFVDDTDYGLWVDAFGQSGDDLAADFSNDGVVDAADYTVWRDNYAPSPVAVPEPMAAGAILTMLAILRGLGRRGHWREG